MMFTHDINNTKQESILTTIQKLSLFLVFNLFLAGIACQSLQPVGWASLNGGTSGGEGGDTIRISAKSELLRVLNLPQKRIIVISDTLYFDGKRIDVTEGNLTIMGAGRNAVIRNGGFKLDADNMVIRNICFADYYKDGHWDGKGDAGADAISVYGKNIWIDHCELSHGFDGLLDISKEADYITVSWCKFFNHNKVMLIGSKDTDTMSRGHLRTTIHHCWFDGYSTFYDAADKKEYRLTQRMPRARFGDVHVFNNYYEQVADYGIAARFESDVVVENNYFRNLRDPHIIDDIGKGIEDPDLVASGNIYDNTRGAAATHGNAFNPSEFYTCVPDPAELIPAIVMNGAGIFDHPGNTPPVLLNDTVQIRWNEPAKIKPLENDRDVDGDQIRISAILNNPAGSTIVFPDFIDYIPRKDFTGHDTIEYQVIDFEGGTSVSRILINVKNE